MTITVSQLSNFLKALIDNEPMLSGVNVRGEISTLRYAAGAVYFILKDESAQIDCFWYTQSPPPLKDGAAAVVSGRPVYYSKSGRLSFCVSAVKETGGEGAARLEFLKLKQKLESEGLFDAARKRPVTANALNIGVVTSAGGAVIHDIMTVAARRNPCVNVILYDVRVQGAESAAMLAAGLDYFCNSDVDVVIIGRGGGSDEDLAAFNSETAARAAARCSKPVISAVGHETDRTLCDLVCDFRAPTPSAAAEICTLDTAAWKRNVMRRLEACGESVSEKLAAQTRLTEHISMGFARVFGTVLNRGAQALSSRCGRLTAAAENNFNSKLNKLREVSSAVEQNNPLKLLRQGYSALLAGDGSRITLTEQVAPGQEIKAYLSDGMLTATVTGKEKHKI